MWDLVKVGGGEVVRSFVGVSGGAQRLEEDLRHYDRRTEVYHYAVLKLCDDADEAAEVRQGRGAEFCSIQCRVGVDDVCAEGDMDGYRD